MSKKTAAIWQPFSCIGVLSIFPFNFQSSEKGNKFSNKTTKNHGKLPWILKNETRGIRTPDNLIKSYTRLFWVFFDYFFNFNYFFQFYIRMFLLNNAF